MKRDLLSLAVNSNLHVRLIDFYDSFTHNIVSELHHLEIKCQVIPIDRWHLLWSQGAYSQLGHENRREVIIWGPGPGHPDDYLSKYNIVEMVDSLSQRKNIFQLGICLGHQLIWRAFGVRSLKSDTPLHGGKVELKLPLWCDRSLKGTSQKIWVQRYNSLNLSYEDYTKLRDNQELVAKHGDLKLYFQSGECLLGKFCRGITYQFHPESVGTSYRSLFFRPVEKFLYNSNDEDKG
ncbi:MAG: hypothetical protein HN730_04930 [Bdellovibrionales bacterium]|nr:hypothetical protein [Bdellovibrionales bacterium]